MKQWIRWSGLAGFIIISTVIVLLGVFAAGPLIKFSLETLGAKAAGAKVDVGAVNVHYSPLSVELLDVHVANSDKPMENLLQFDKALADVEWLPLFLGKVILGHLTLTGLEFSQARTESGALVVKSTVHEAGKGDNTGDHSDVITQGLAGVKQALPSADELLAREPLLTEQRGKAFQQQFKASQQAVDESLKNIPDDKDLAQYEEAFKRLIHGRFDSLADFNARKKEFDALKKRIKSDRDTIQNARQQVVSAKKTLQQKWAQLQRAPKEDLANLKSKYQLDGAGLGNVSALLFGEQAGELSKKAMYWYEKAKPLLATEDKSSAAESGADHVTIARQEGRFVHFPSDRPLPDFLIADTQLQMTLAAGELDIHVTDITHQQAVIDRPTVITASGDRLQEGASFLLKGRLDYRKQPSTEYFDLLLNNWRLKNYDLGAFGMKLNKSKLDISAKGTLTDGQLKATANGVFNDATFSSKDTTLMAKEMVIALAKIDAFNINASARGALTQPKISIQSDLEKKLSRAFSERLDDKQRELEANIQSKLNDKLLSYAGGYQEELKALDLANGSFESKQQQLQQLASTNMSSFQQQKEAEAKKKLDDAAKKQREALEKKAKDKLKNLFN